MSFENQFFDYFNILEQKLKLRPLNLGGVSASGGGGGGPPGGYVGMLPQYRVAYDNAELESNDLLGSGNLIDNLNHIRYRLSHVEDAGIVTGEGVTLKQGGTIVASGVTVIDFINASVAEKFGSPHEIIVTCSGGGSGESLTATGTLWEPRAKPASPHSMDDEFDDETFDTTKWTTFNPNGDLTIYEYGPGLIFFSANNSRIAGITQPVPVGTSWSVWTKVSTQGLQDGDTKAGIMLMEGTSSQKFFVASYYCGGETGWQVEDFPNYNSGSSNTYYNETTGWPISGVPGWIRLRWVNGTVEIDFSGDGFSWMRKDTRSCPFTPTKVGLFIRQSGGGARFVEFSFFRATNWNAVTDITEGNRIKYFV
jgi:hypothetical protein